MAHPSCGIAFRCCPAATCFRCSHSHCTPENHRSTRCNVWEQVFKACPGEIFCIGGILLYGKVSVRRGNDCRSITAVPVRSHRVAWENIPKICSIIDIIQGIAQHFRQIRFCNIGFFRRKSVILQGNRQCRCFAAGRQRWSIILQDTVYR